MTVGPATPVTALADREVYAADGRYVGRVVDIVVELETSDRPALALQDVNESVVGTLPEDAAGLRVPYRDVRAVGDVVVLSEPVGAAGSGEAAGDSQTPGVGRSKTEDQSSTEGRSRTEDRSRTVGWSSVESPSGGIPDEADPCTDEQDGKDRDGDLVP